MMTPTFRLAALLMVAGAPGTSFAQTTTVPLTADRWTASDTIRFETHLGRPSLYINKGVALARDVDVRNGTIEYDMAATNASNFMGASFHAKALDFSEALILRLGQSGTAEAVQYAPAFNDYGAAWQIYHGDGSNAVAVLRRNEWVHVKIELSGSKASIYVNDSTKPLLVVPQLAGSDGGGFGVWGGNFGRGAYYSNIRYSRDANPVVAEPSVVLPRGTIADWQLSQVFDASAASLGKMDWEPVRVERNGVVLINRYRRAPAASLPRDPDSHAVLEDSVMAGRVPGTKVVFARAVIESDRERVTRMRFGYSDGVRIYVNDEPLFFGMNPTDFRGLGVMETNGDAVYVHLKKGRNELVFEVTEYFGGWGFWAQLDR